MPVRAGGGRVQLELFDKKRLLGKQRRLGVTRSSAAGDRFAASLLSAVSADGPNKNRSRTSSGAGCVRMSATYGVALSRVVEQLASDTESGGGGVDFD